MRDDDRIVTLISRWLARHVDDGELERGIREIGTGELSPEHAEAVEELLAELSGAGSRGTLERAARETLEALAVGG